MDPESKGHLEDGREKRKGSKRVPKYWVGQKFI